MSDIALPLTNVLLGLAGIGAGIGFGVAEKQKMAELKKMSTVVESSSTKAGDLYDHTYYPVAVNLDRLRTAIDKLPSDLLAQVESDIDAILASVTAKSAITAIGKVLGYTSRVLKGLSGIIASVRAIQANRQAAGEPDPTLEPGDNPYIDLPGGDRPLLPENVPETLPQTALSEKIQKGLDVGALVFAIGGLAATIGLGVWTLEKLNEALDEVTKKQVQVTKFENAMTKVLDGLLADAGLPAKSYDQLQTMAGKWKEIAQKYEGYSKELNYAIQGFFQGKSLEDVKKFVDRYRDDGLKPFPDDGYTLAKALADDIRFQFEAKKTDKQVVEYFATACPEIGHRLVFDEYFISTLR